MAQRFNIATPRKKKDGGTYWVNIGTAWADEKGTQLVFDALPIPDDEGRCVARLFEPRENGPRAQSARNDRQGTGGNTYTDDGDSVPF